MITIIDYGLGNLASVANALRKLGIPFEISGDSNELKKATALILPGVGAAGKGMENLRKLGLDSVIIDEVKSGKPILSICLGMQLLLSKSEEGNVPCLNLVKGKVKKFRTKLKVPEIGWNEVGLPRSLSVARNDGLLTNISDNSYFYFVNSYVCVPDDASIITGVTDYDGNFCSIFEKDSMYGVQFHPEKSGEVGLQLLKNFYLLTKKL